MSFTQSARTHLSRRLRLAGLVGAMVTLALVLGLTAFLPAQDLRQARRPTGYIGGVVESSAGPEAGVWVIAETNDLPTKFVKIVVTNNDGRFALPELPVANYNVWVRGYGLVDSQPIKAKPGQTLSLKALLATSPQQAARIYPANYWYSLLEPPAKSEFPGTGPEGNGISPNLKTQSQWIDVMKQGCQLCHQLGNQLTREVGHMTNLGFKSTREAWDYRLQTGQRSFEMSSMINRFGRQRGLQMYADWTDRIMSGEVPAAPPRPRGPERNVVITMWDWGTETSYMHDEITTAKSNPRLNANGPLYSIADGDGYLVMVDPLENAARQVKIPTRDDSAKIPFRFPKSMLKPSNFFGDKLVWTDPSDPHNPMMDVKGRVWLTSVIRDRPNPDWCKNGALNKFAAYFPLATSTRQASYYSPTTGKWTLIDTCFSTHHLQFGEDPNQTLYFSGGGPVLGWIDTKLYDQTGDETRSVGWCPTVVDTNGDGKITKPWNEPAGAQRSQEEGAGGGRIGVFDPKLDTRIQYGSYGIIASPADHSAWASSTDFPGHIVRFTPGANPPETCKTEVYEVPNGDVAFGPRGIDVDRNGVIWAALSGSGGLASFDRRKCRGLDGPQHPEGKQCEEGWRIYPLKNSPSLKGTDVNADFHYYNWVDQFNTAGLGENLPIATGSGSDSLLVLTPPTGEWLTLRVPYPLGFYSRGLDGRIDDPAAGWKGRGLWANYGTNFIWHTEGGKGTKSKIVHFQVRPDPLAR